MVPRRERHNDGPTKVNSGVLRQRRVEGALKWEKRFGRRRTRLPDGGGKEVERIAEAKTIQVLARMRSLETDDETVE